MSPFHDPDELPRAFGDYTLIKPLGRGGMGQVYLAQLKGRGLSGVDKICVIKTLRPTNDPEYERRFIDEARLIVLLGHKNICPTFDAGCFEGEYYLAMEHVAGRELRTLQRAAEVRAQPMPASVVIHILKEILEGLDAAHRMAHPLTGTPLRVVHRDVSPQNVMVSAEGEVKLIDFGLAVSTQKVERTAPQIVMGKMAYMAPEQARGDAVDGRADQFACGVMLYELLANERYYGDLPFDVMWRLSGSGGHRPRLLDTLPVDVRDVILKATAASRDERYASCGDMRDALTAIELRRGTIAGSRDVRIAQHDLDNVSMPSLSSTMPPPVSVPSASFDSEGLKTIVDPPKEKTRTFRVISAENSGSLFDSLEPGAATMSARASTNSHLTPITTSLKPGPKTDRDDDAAKTIEIKPVSPFEQTQIVRTNPTALSLPAALAAQQAAKIAPVVDDEPQKKPVAAIIGGVVVAAVVVVVFALWPSKPSVETPAVVVDAGSIVAVADVDAVEPTPVEAVVVDAGAIVDAVEPVAAVVDAGIVEAPKPAVPVVSKPTTKKPPPPPVVVKPKGRELPPLPPPPALIFARTKLLKEQCGDVPCAKSVLAKLASNEPRDQVEAAVSACYATCAKTPKP